MKIGFIGAGKVGFSLGKYFAENGLEISGYYSRSESSALEVAVFTGSELFVSAEELVSASDAVFLTVPDSAIKETYSALPKDLLCGRQICHCSGAMSAEEAFPNMKEKVRIFDIGPTIGAHTGPGTVAIGFWGKEKEE